MCNARVDAMVLAYIAALAEPSGTPAWREPVKTKRSRSQAKKRKAKRSRARESRKRNR